MQARVLAAMREQVSGHELDADTQSALQDLAVMASQRIVSEPGTSEADVVAMLQTAFRRLRTRGDLTAVGIRRLHEQTLK